MNEGVKKALKIAIPAIVGVIIAMIQPPEGLRVKTSKQSGRATWRERV